MTNGLDHRHQHAQVTRSRLAPGDDGADVLVDTHFQRVDLMVILLDQVAQIHVAVHQGFKGLLDLFFDKTTHLQHPGTQALQFRIELLGSMFTRLAHCRTLQMLEINQTRQYDLSMLHNSCIGIVAPQSSHALSTGQQGDIGTVVMVHRGGQGYEVEFITLDGKTVAVVSLLAKQLQPIG